MKVVMDGLIFQKDPHGGIARMYRELLPRLAALDADLEITLVTDGSVRGALPQHERIRVRRLPPVRPRLRPKGEARRLIYPIRRGLEWAWSRLRQAGVGDGGGAIWHSTFYTLPIRWSGPQVACLHDLIPENHVDSFSDPMEEIGRRRKRRCVDEAEIVVCVSRETLRQAMIHYNLPERRFEVIHHAAGAAFRRLEQNEIRPAAIPSEPYLLYVGGRARYKNFDLLLEAYAGWERCNQVRLVVVGGSWQPEEKWRIKALGIDERVWLKQEITDDDLCRLYNRAAALVFPSLEEGFGLPLVEAMACGCPIVASNIPSTVEVAADIPILFEPGDVTGCREGLEQVWQGSGRTGRIELGLERAATYTWDAAAQSWLEVYRRAARKAANP